MQVGITFDFINHNFQLEFVDSGLYFVEDKNNFIYPLLQDPDPMKKLTDPKPKFKRFERSYLKK